MRKVNVDMVEIIDRALGSKLIIDLGEIETEGSRKKFNLTEFMTGNECDHPEKFDSIYEFKCDLFGNCSDKTTERLIEIYDTVCALREISYKFYDYPELRGHERVTDPDGYAVKIIEAMNDLLTDVINEFIERSNETDEMKTEKALNRAKILIERI